VPLQSTRSLGGMRGVVVTRTLVSILDQRSCSSLHRSLW